MTHRWLQQRGTSSAQLTPGPEWTPSPKQPQALGLLGMPPPQVSGAVQTSPQSPQFAFVPSWTQAPPQRVKPGLQAKPQAPSRQTAVALATVVVQRLPQVPQWLRLVWRLTQAP